MSNTEWRPKVGERVAIYGEVKSICLSGLINVALDGGMFDTQPFDLPELSPLPSAPEPRKPWEVLREAADIIARESGHTKGGAAFDFLTFEAARLEAAAASKPPTLVEAVRAYLGAMEGFAESVRNVTGKPFPWPEQQITKHHLHEALVRAENGA